MNITIGAIAALAQGLQARFLEGWDTPTPHDGWYDEVESTHASEVHVFSGGAMALREWVGDREGEAAPAFDYELKNKNWQSTIKVDRNHIEDDQIGFYGAQARQLGAAARVHPTTLLATLLLSGFTAKGYDKVPFFSASHPIQDGTQSNLQAGALSATTFNEAYAKLLSQKTWHGQPIYPESHGGELVLLVGPELRATAAAIVEAQTGTGGAANINYGKAKLQVLPGLTGSQWFLGIRGGAARPLLLQMRRKPEMVEVTAADAESVFSRREYAFGVDGRWNAGYGWPQLMIGSQGS